MTALRWLRLLSLIGEATQWLWRVRFDVLSSENRPAGERGRLPLGRLFGAVRILAAWADRG